MSPEFGRKWGTECPHTRFPLPTLLCAGYSVKLIYLIFYLQNNITFYLAVRGIQRESKKKYNVCNIETNRQLIDLVSMCEVMLKQIRIVISRVIIEYVLDLHRARWGGRGTLLVSYTYLLPSVKLVNAISKKLVFATLFYFRNVVVIYLDGRSGAGAQACDCNRDWLWVRSSLEEIKIVKRRRSPLYAEFWRHCVLSGGTQRRALPRHQSEEMKI